MEQRSVRVWEKLDRSLNPAAAARGEGGEGQQQQQDGSAVFLWFRRVSEEEPLSWSAHSLTVRRKGTSRERERGYEDDAMGQDRVGERGEGRKRIEKGCGGVHKEGRRVRTGRKKTSRERYLAHELESLVRHY